MGSRARRRHSGERLLHSLPFRATWLPLLHLLGGRPTSVVLCPLRPLYDLHGLVFCSLLATCMGWSFARSSATCTGWSFARPCVQCYGCLATLFALAAPHLARTASLLMLRALWHALPLSALLAWPTMHMFVLGQHLARTASFPMLRALRPIMRMAALAADVLGPC